MKTKLDDSEQKLLGSLENTWLELAKELQKCGGSEQGDFNAENFVSKFQFKFVGDPDPSLSFGFLCRNNVHPWDLTLEVSSGFHKLRTGGFVILSVSSDKPVFSETIKKSLVTLVSLAADSESFENTVINVQRKVAEDEKEMKLRFKVPKEGVYLVTVKLYDRHVTNSPLQLPILDNPEESLSRVGITLASIASSSDLDNTAQSVPTISPFKSAPNTPEEIKSLKQQLSQNSVANRKEKIRQLANGSGQLESLVPKLSESPEVSPQPTLKVEKELLRNGANRTLTAASKTGARKSEVAQVYDVNDSLDVDDAAKGVDVASARSSGQDFGAVGKTIVKTETEDVSSAGLTVGQAVEVLMEDGLRWEAAIVHKYISVNNMYVVKVASSGQFRGVQSDMVRAKEKAAAVEEEDQPTSMFKVGKLGIARWNKDNVWYNAKILESRKDLVKVLFMDYGNEDWVLTSDFVKSFEEIPSSRTAYIDPEVDQGQKPHDQRDVVFNKSPHNSNIVKTSGSLEVTISNDRHKEFGSRQPVSNSASLKVTIDNDHHKELRKPTSAGKVPSNLLCCLCGYVWNCR